MSVEYTIEESLHSTHTTKRIFNRNVEHTNGVIISFQYVYYALDNNTKFTVHSTQYTFNLEDFNRNIDYTNVVVISFKYVYYAFLLTIFQSSQYTVHTELRGMITLPNIIKLN